MISLLQMSFIFSTVARLVSDVTGITILRFDIALLRCLTAISDFVLTGDAKRKAPIASWRGPVPD
jgi:hypothetical protein